MNEFTDEKIVKYADDLLIGLTFEERKMIKDEFVNIEKNMDLINKIDNIKDVEILSYPFDMEITDLRNDNEEGQIIPIEELLSNCDDHDAREVQVPKVVG